jgi:ComF family protein
MGWSLLFPSACAACDELVAEGRSFCERCAGSLYPIGPACPRCALPTEGAIATECRRCRRVPPPFAAVSAGYRFGGELATAIRRFKYGGKDRSGRRDLARPLASLLGPLLAARPSCLVVPVPLSPRRLAERGFSQALELARLAAPGRVVPALVRVRETQEQAGLDRTGRVRNVAGAFAAVTHAVAGHPVALVDDVVTTGATAAACARALRRAGAVEVVVCALARAE